MTHARHFRMLGPNANGHTFTTPVDIGKSNVLYG